MPESAPPPAGTAPVPALKKSAWNLLLLLPLVVLITPIYNRTSPELFGLPMYYWFQFACVPRGVVAVGIVFVKTRHH
ncbi:MAG: DUF3311 domain-containing protein [Mycobacteriaceae bacterium]